jgi:hypothetical protein
MPGHATSFPPNIIDTDQLYDGAITDAKIAAGTITTDKIAAATITIANITALGSTGTTLQRPATPIMGQYYFDTTLVIPIWWNGTNWTNSAGAPV